MRTGIDRCGRVMASLVACVALAPAGAASAQDPGARLEARGGAQEALATVVLEGLVLEPDGSPAEGAVVVSSAGGRAVADGRGGYRLAIEVPLAAESVQLTAVGAAGRSRLASTIIPLPSPTGRASVDPLFLMQGSTCSPSWLSTFGGQGTNGAVYGLTVYDDGSGPALYLGGAFTTAGGKSASRVARFDGSTWSALGSGVNATVRELVVFDDGGGPALYAGGEFTTAGGVTANHVARWDGSSWSALGSGTNGWVRSFAVHDDGGGPALFVGGSFTSAGGLAASRVAKWDGASWSALGSGTSDGVFALTEYDDGSGPALYAGGGFLVAGGIAASHIARWDGSAWSALGSGIPTGGVHALAVHDDGGGPALYVGGSFTTAGGVTANRIARWDGSSWSALGSGMNNDVNALAVHDEGGGPALYAGGLFSTADGVAASRLAKWNGTSWSGGGGVTDDVLALAAYDDGSGGARLHAGGRFLQVSNGQPANHLALLDGSSWTSVTAGLDQPVSALAVYDDGSGPALYASGSFDRAGSVTLNGFGKWDGSSWSALGTPPSPGSAVAFDLEVYDDGSGPALFAGGAFTSLGGVAASRIARWDGTSWSALGSGVTGSGAQVESLAVHDDGSGPALYVGGSFTSAGGMAASRIARWNGSSWAPLGSGLNNTPMALAAYDDGGGPALYAGGFFTTAGGVPASRIARWDGASWTPLGSGMDGTVYSLAVYDDGGGPALYAGGFFTSAGGVPASRIARWDGASWTSLGSGVGDFVFALRVHDDGGGPALYAGGQFTSAGGMTANRIARWDGASWSALGGGVTNGIFPSVTELAVFDDGGGPALFAGGSFLTAVDSGDAYLAKWGYAEDVVPPTLSCPSSVAVADAPGSPPGEVVSFAVSASDCIDPAPSIVCVPPSGSFFPRGTTLVTCTATDASGNQSTCQFPVTVWIKARRR